MSDPASPTASTSPDPAARPAVVFAGGDPTPDDLLAAQWAVVPSDALVVAADSGLHAAQRLGVPVDVVVGDLDSVDPTALATARAAGCRVEQHPPDKDATDLELAVAAARALGAGWVTVLGGSGGRHDHLLANALVLATDAFADLVVDAYVDTAACRVVRHRRTFAGAIGSVCSLLPVGGTAHGVTTSGLRYPLADDDLQPGSTRGVSNELTAPVAEVTVRAGVLLVVQPHALSPRPPADPES